MKGLLYTVLELEEWCSGKMPCSFCPTNLFGEKNKIVCQIRTRSEVSHRIVENYFACKNCKEKFLNEELSKCERCGRLKTNSNVDFFSGKYVCECEKETKEKELLVLPHEEREATFYEWQINALREEKEQLSEEVDIHLDALQVSQEWSKEKINRIKELEAEVAKLVQENKRLEELTPQELIIEIESHKEEVARLKTQLENLNSQQSAQIEVKRWPWLKVRK